MVFKSIAFRKYHTVTSKYHTELTQYGILKSDFLTKYHTVLLRYGISRSDFDKIPYCTFQIPYRKLKYHTVLVRYGIFSMVF